LLLLAALDVGGEIAEAVVVAIRRMRIDAQFL
jgi:hypothetical protein